MGRRGAGAALAVVAAVAVALSHPGAARAEGPVGPLGWGAVVALKGTPHLWFADERGVLHWGGDTRALAGREIRWDRRTEVTLDELLALPRGAPWLSAGLVQAGEPIYFVKWETGAQTPTLLRVQSIADVELFGIDGSNYNALVLDRGTWEARTGLRTETLSRGELAPAAGAGAARLDAWQPYVSAEGRYAALLPRGSFEVPLDELAAPRVETPQGPMAGRMIGFGAVRPEGPLAYVMAHYDLPESLAPAAQTLTPEALAELFGAVRDGFTGTGYGQVLAERPLLLGTYPGQEFTAGGQGDGGLATVRLYLVGGRLYILVAARAGAGQGGRGGAVTVPPEVALFLDSFRLTG